MHDCCHYATLKSTLDMCGKGALHALPPTCTCRSLMASRTIDTSLFTLECSSHHKI